MIRRAFLRRMAHAAMAGMLGVELLTRAPEVGWDDHEIHVRAHMWYMQHYRELGRGIDVRYHQHMVDHLRAARGFYDTP